MSLLCLFKQPELLYLQIVAQSCLQILEVSGTFTLFERQTQVSCMSNRNFMSSSMACPVFIVLEVFLQKGGTKQISSEVLSKYFYSSKY